MSYINARALQALHEDIRKLREYPYKIVWRGLEVKCQTPEDVLALTRKLGRKPPMIECETPEQAVAMSDAVLDRKQ